ncbi:MAG: ABC transporter substrate-binding protein [Firmicutes bacterium]|nr:ABC transporter substrate-binding protein [Bacillota bacterium]
MCKKTTALIIIIICSLLFFPTLSPGAEYSGYQTVGVTVDGAPIEGEVPAIVMDGRTLVPLRMVGEALGASVDWDSSTRTVIITSSSPVQDLSPAENHQGDTYNGYPTVNVRINGYPVSGEVPAIVMDGRTLVPLRLVGEALGASVDWDSSTRTVRIISSHPSGQRKVFKIGLIAPMTGNVKAFGDSTKKGFMLALEQAGMKAGDYDIQYVIADDRNDTVTAVGAAVKLIHLDGVNAIVGSVTSKCSIPISEVAQLERVPMITHTSTNPRTTVTDGKRKEFVFRACFIDPLQGKMAAQFALNDLNARTAAVLYDNGNDYTWGLAEQFKLNFEAGGGRIRAYEAYTQADTSFSTKLIDIATMKVDVLYLPDYYQKVSLIGKQARDMGIKAPFLGGDGWDANEIDWNAMEGGYFTNHYHVDSPNPAYQKFKTDYQAKYGYRPDIVATLAYDATNLMLNAIKTANSDDPEAIRAALQATRDFPAVTGNIRFDSDGNPIKPGVIVQIRNGSQHYYTTINP